MAFILIDMRTPRVFIVILLFLFSQLSAQNISEVKIVVGNLHYYIHTIQTSETLSGIAQNYGVRMKQIEEVNPTLGDPQKIKVGQKVLVPNFSVYAQQFPLDQWDFELYTVQINDKLKNIAKNHNSELKYLKAANPKADSKPIPGTQLRIPIKRQTPLVVHQTDKTKNPALAFNWDKDKDAKEKEVKDAKNKDTDSTKEIKNTENTSCKDYTYKSKEVFNIAFLLPFNTDGDKIDHASTAFMEGALLAIAQQKEVNEVNLQVNIIDIANKTKLSEALVSDQLKKSDLIIGPFAMSQLKSLGDFAQKNKIPFVAPYEPAAKQLVKNNPYFIQIYPSDEAIYSTMCSEDGKNAQIVLVYSTTPDSVMLSNYRKALKEKYGTFSEISHTMGQRVETTIANFKTKIPKDKISLVYVCSNHEAFVSDLMNRLLVMKKNGHDIKLYGRLQWRNFKIIDASSFFDLEVRMSVPFYIDYQTEDTKNFVKTYRETYNNEPTQYAFHAFDITNTFITALYKNGRNFLPCLDKLRPNTMQGKFQFKRPDQDTGYTNESSYLIRYTPEIKIERE